MPELSKPLIAVIGVLVSIAILFIAVLGILPFLQGTVGSVSQTSQFSMTVAASTAEEGGTIKTVVFTVNVQRLAGTGSFNISKVTIYFPNGSTATASISPSLPVSFANSASVSAVVSNTGGLPSGDWVVVVEIKDASSGDVVQVLSSTVNVS